MGDPPTPARRNDGSRLGEKFATWLLEIHGFERVEPRQLLRGAVATRPFEADLVGVRGLDALWVECKDVEAGVSRRDVAVLEQAVDDVRRNTTGWKPTRVAIVARRFQPDALRFALLCKFECYVETTDGFELAPLPIA